MIVSPEFLPDVEFPIGMPDLAANVLTQDFMQERCSIKVKMGFLRKTQYTVSQPNQSGLIDGGVKFVQEQTIEGVVKKKSYPKKKRVFVLPVLHVLPRWQVPR